MISALLNSPQRSENGKHISRFQSETSVLKFLQCSVNGAKTGFLQPLPGKFSDHGDYLKTSIYEKKLAIENNNNWNP